MGYIATVTEDLVLAVRRMHTHRFRRSGELGPQTRLRSERSLSATLERFRGTLLHESAGIYPVGRNIQAGVSGGVSRGTHPNSQ